MTVLSQLSSFAQRWRELTIARWLEISLLCSFIPLGFSYAQKHKLQFLINICSWYSGNGFYVLLYPVYLKSHSPLLPNQLKVVAGPCYMICDE